MYDKKFISVTSHAFDPPPPVKLSHFLGPPRPLERDVLYGRPLAAKQQTGIALLFRYIITNSPPA